MSKTVPFQTIQFSISTQFSFIWPIDRTLLGATTPGQSGLGSNGNKEVFCIPQSSRITGASPSDCLVSYPGHSLGESYPSAEIQLVYSIAQVDWARLQRGDSILLKAPKLEPHQWMQFSVILSTANWKRKHHP